MIELAAVRLGIPFEKEMQWLVADDPTASGKGDSALDYVLGPQGALRPERLDALVIAIDRTPAVRDLAQRARLRAQCHNRRVDIACFPDGRVNKYARRSKYVDWLLVQEPPRHVEIVDHHVAEQPARAAHIFDRRRTRIAARDRQQFEAANAAVADLAFEPRETRVEAAVEADHQRHVAFLGHGNARRGAAAVKVERLFAEHRLAGACRGFDKIGMGVGRAGNHDRLYGAVGKSLRLTANRGTVAAGYPLRRGAVGIDDDA